MLSVLKYSGRVLLLCSKQSDLFDMQRCLTVLPFFTDGMAKLPSFNLIHNC